MGKSYNRYNKLRSVDLDAARWTDGFWAEKFEMCKNATIPSIKKALDIPEKNDDA